MKRSSLLFLLIFSFTFLYCQKKVKIEDGDLTSLKGVERVEIVFDFNNAKIENVPEEDFGTYVPNWEENKLYATYAFCRGFNRSTRFFSSSTAPVAVLKECKYKMILEIKSIDFDGDCECCLVFYKSGSEIARTNIFETPGNSQWDQLIGIPTALTFGSATCKALYSAGEKVGDFVKSEIE